MSDDWKTWMGGKDPKKARDGLIHMLEVCVGDCELMATEGRAALEALQESADYWNPELEEAVAGAVRTMDNYMLFPLGILRGALGDWREECGFDQRQALRLAEKRAAEALAEVERLRASVASISLPALTPTPTEEP